jgi:hypothetical protein
LRYARQQTIHRLNKTFRSTYNAASNHHNYLKWGFVPMSDALASMQRYKSDGYNPLPGDIGEDDHRQRLSRLFACVLLCVLFLVVVEPLSHRFIFVASFKLGAPQLKC